MSQSDTARLKARFEDDYARSEPATAGDAIPDSCNKCSCNGCLQ